MKFHKRINGGAYDYANHLWLPISQDRIAICPVEGVEPSVPFKEWTVVNEEFVQMNTCGPKIIGYNATETMLPPMTPGTFRRTLNLFTSNHPTCLYVLDKHMIITPNVSMAHDELINRQSLKNGRYSLSYQGVKTCMPFDTTKLNRSHVALNFPEIEILKRPELNGMWFTTYGISDPYICHPDPIVGVIPGVDIVAVVCTKDGGEYANFAPSSDKAKWKSDIERNGTYDNYDMEADKTAWVEHYFYIKAKDKT